MRPCKRVQRSLTDRAGPQEGSLPAALQPHLATCPTCRRSVAARRLARGLVGSLAETEAPPAHFSTRVLRCLSAREVIQQAVADPWRPAWGLVPVFAALVVGLFLLDQPRPDPEVPGLLATSDLSASEHLVLKAGPAPPDLVLAAVLEDDAP